jgi:hypothetical protein
VKRSSHLLGGFFESMPRFAPAKSPTAEAHSNVDRPIGEIRNRAFLLEQGFAQEVERGCRRLREASQDPELRRQALRWKQGVLHALSLASSSPDPLVSLFDSWVLAGQMQAFFAEGGAGQDAFGAHQAIARETSDAVMAQFLQAAEALVRNSEGSVERGLEAVQGWVAEHPVEDLDFFRSSSAVLYADTAHRVNKGMGDTMVDLADLAQDLSYRIKALTIRLPSQAAGEAELLAAAALKPLDVEGLKASLDGLSASLDRLEARLQPSVVEALAFGEKALARVSEERAAALSEAERMANRLLRTLLIGFGTVTFALVLVAWLLWRA